MISLEAIVVLLILLWALGYFVMPIGGVVHLLLVIALVVILIRVIQGRAPLV